METTGALNKYLTEHCKRNTKMKVFLSGKNTMLTGTIKDFDDVVIILDDCMILIDKITSITPERS